MKIAIVGATGLVGTNIINLGENYFDLDVEYTFFASKSSEGKKLKINDKELIVKNLIKKILENITLHFFQLAAKDPKNMPSISLKKARLLLTTHQFLE